MEDEKGVQIFAQIDEKDGALVSFDYYEACTKNILDEESCLKKAEAFLDKLGIADMRAIDLQSEGTNLDIRFAVQIDDVVHYGKEVVVKVCRERGKVVGYNGEKYLKNRDTMAEFNAKITLQEAQDALHESLTVESSRAVLFPYRGRSYSAYEFFVSVDGGYYFLYTDATTGNQLFIKRA
jgi:germination protein YpeB